MCDGIVSGKVVREKMGGQYDLDYITDDQWAPYHAEMDRCCMKTCPDFPAHHVVEQKQHASSLQQAGRDHDYAQRMSDRQSIRRFRSIPCDSGRPSNEFHPKMCDLLFDDETSYGCSFNRSSMESCNVTISESARFGLYNETTQPCLKQGNLEASRATSFEQTPHASECSGRNIHHGHGHGHESWGANEDVYERNDYVNACDTALHTSVYGNFQDSGRVEESVRVDRMVRNFCLGGDESSFEVVQPTPSDRFLQSEAMCSRLSAHHENTQRFIKDCSNLWGEDTVHAASHAILQKAAKEGDICTTERCADFLLQVGKLDVLVRPLNILLGAFMKHGDVKRANYWWDRYVSSGVKPSLVTYNTMISICVRAGQISQAEWWLERLVQDGVQPCHVSFTTLIKACGQSKSSARAEYWFQRMRAVGLQGDLVLHNAMIDVYTKCSNIKKAENWLYQMQEEGVLPCQRTFNMLVHACAKSGNMKRASKWHMEMHRAGYRSDVYTYGALLEGCARCADADLADYYIQCMCRERLTPNIVCLRSLAKVYIRFEDVTRLTNRLLYCMRNCGVSRHVIDQALASISSRLSSAVSAHLHLNVGSCEDHGCFKYPSGRCS